MKPLTPDNLHKYGPGITACAVRGYIVGITTCTLQIEYYDNILFPEIYEWDGKYYSLTYTGDVPHTRRIYVLVIESGCIRSMHIEQVKYETTNPE